MNNVTHTALRERERESNTSKKQKYLKAIKNIALLVIDFIKKRRLMLG